MRRSISAGACAAALVMVMSFAAGVAGDDPERHAGTLHSLSPADGLLVIRRNMAPHIGRLALPGGYIEFHETWQAGAARELYEEAGIRISENSVRRGFAPEI